MREQFGAKLTKSASTSISHNLRWTNSIWFPTTMGKNGSRATNYSNNMGVMWKSFGWNDGENVKKICVKRTTWKSRNGSWRPNVSSSKYSSHFDQSNKLLCGRWGWRRQAKPYLSAAFTSSFSCVVCRILRQLNQWFLHLLFPMMRGYSFIKKGFIWCQEQCRLMTKLHPFWALTHCSSLVVK
jgi:hypothetical protein